MKDEFRIGREKDNDLVIANPKVSGHHAVLRKTLNGLFLEDMKSTNGTYVNGARIERTPIRPGDLIQFSRQIPLDWSNQNLLNWINIPIEMDDMEVAESPESWLNLSAQIEQKDILTIGRAIDNDIVLDHPRVSRHHARLKRISNDSWTIEDLESVNGCFVDGKRVQNHVITRNSRIVIAGSPLRLFEDNGSVVASDSLGEARIEIRDFSLTIPTREGKRTLLNNISFVVEAGEFVGVIGPSGSGKTTLMMAMNGYLDPTQGVVLINDVDIHKEKEHFRGFIGYVPQDDIIHRELTVQSCLTYSAQLRLPDLTRDERSREVDRVIHDLGLEKTRKTEIGTAEKKGISGGQRKRVNTAQELITEPSVIFLDEPCSGLDPKSDIEVMRLLQGLSQRGKTVFLTTHNITSKNFQLLDTLIVLTEGGFLAYYGSAAGVAEYFGVNEPDQIFDALKKMSGVDWANRFKNSRVYDSYMKDRISNGSIKGDSSTAMTKVRTSWKQLLVLASRYFEIKVRDRLQSIILLAQAPIIGLLLALVFR